jgi:MFS family permease
MSAIAATTTARVQASDHDAHAAVHPGHQQLISLLDKSPLRLPHYLAWALSSGGTLLDGLSVFMLGLAIPLLDRTLGLSALQTGLLGAALVMGAAIGALSGGWLADRLGRKSVFLLDMGLLGLAGLFSALAWNPWLLIGTQLVVGISIGMDFPVSSSYVAECMPHRSRSRMMVATIASQSVGMVLAAVLSIGLLHLSGSDQAWRLFFAGEAVIAALFLVARLQLPESPRWLMGQGRNREAVHALSWLIPEDQQMLESLATRLGHTVHHVAKKMARKTPATGYALLFSSVYLRRTLLSTVPWFLMDVATYGVGLFTATLLAAMHFEQGSQTHLGAVESLAGGTGLIDLFLVVGFVMGLWAVARYGRIRMQLVGFAGMAAGMSVLLVSTLLSGGAEAHLVLMVSGFVLFNLFMNMGPNSTTYILPAELFPTQARATAAGFAASAAKVGATLGVFTLPIVKTDTGVPTVLGLMVGVSLMGLVATWLLRVEGHGLTLEQHHTEDLP